MEIDSLGPYSPDIVYGQLSSPFIPNNIKINAHTPFDKAEETENGTSFSVKDFTLKKYATSKLMEKNDDNYTFGIQEEIKTSFLESRPEAPEFPPKSVKSFSASSLSAKDIVQGAIKRGYNTTEAYNVYRTQQAYKDYLNGTPVNNFSTRSYTVS